MKCDMEGQKSDKQKSVSSLDRYSRQVIYPPIGRSGQEKLLQSSITLVGCGALGSTIAELLVRAGIGSLRIIDRDFVELSNLQRQMLFDEQDVAENLPKAIAAVRKLGKINQHVKLTPIVADVSHITVAALVQKPTLILDGTDNLLVRFILNDYAIKNRVPWIYTACLGATGMGLFISQSGRPCLGCVLDELPGPGQTDTCDTAGILAPAVTSVASFAVCEAIKYLTGNKAAQNRHLYSFDLWRNRHYQMSLDALTDGCPCCRDRQFDYLNGKAALSTFSLCGRDAVQVRPQHPDASLDLADLAIRLRGIGTMTHNEFLLKLTTADHEITLFPDARAIIKGTEDINQARTIYSRLIGC